MENNNFREYDEKLNENINNLNDSNTKLFINDEPRQFRKFFKPKVEGEYKIKIVFKNKLDDCSYMFRGCINITEVKLILKSS